MIQKVYATGIIDQIHGADSELAQYNNLCDLREMRVNSTVYFDPNHFICDKEFNNQTFLAIAREFIGKHSLELSDFDLHVNKDSKCYKDGIWEHSNLFI